MRVDFNFFKDAGRDGNAMSLEDRIKETVKNSEKGGKIELFYGDELFRICRKEEDLRSALRDLGLKL